MTEPDPSSAPAQPPTPAAPKKAAMEVLTIPGETIEEIEGYWLREVYQGDDMPQFTLRSAIMGALIGCIMCLSNLYVGLKTGWGLGVVITACILSYAMYGALVRLAPKLFGPQMSILENNAMASTASSAGYSTGGTMVSATAAYLLVTGHHIPWQVLLPWTFFLSALGVFFAIPMKRQMVNVEQLRFPTGTAAAVTLRSLYATGREAVLKARALGIAGIVGAAVAWFRDGMAALSLPAIPASIPIPGKIWGASLGGLTIQFDNSLIMIAAGAIMGMRVAVSLLIGAVVCWGVLAPWVYTHYHHEVITDLGYRGIVAWTVWTGVSIMVTSSLLQFAMSGKTIVRALSGLFSVFKRSARGSDDPMARIEVPSSWFLGGLVVMSIGTVLTARWGFHIPVAYALLAIAMSFVLCLVACRATGETDTTPVGALGKITQLTYGVLIPQNMVANLMTASITGNTASSSADLLTDLKSGYLLGANPRKQFLAQFVGCFIGTLVIVPVFYLLVPTPDALGGDKFPAPAAQVWEKVARLLATGLDALHPSARWGMVIGGLIGLALPLLERMLPQRVKTYVPSATGLGLAFVIPFFNSLSMFLGALIAWLLEKTKPDTAERYVIPVSAGLIAGESILGIVVALIQAMQ